jgi:A/G-specific adenine glycosylase
MSQVRHHSSLEGAPTIAGVSPVSSHHLMNSRALAVLEWAATHSRDLPWRHTRDPWAILVSEIMAQQTQVERVIPKWEAFLELWPTPQVCASAPLGDVLRLWQGLGYPRRAKNLHLAAGVISESGESKETTGRLPNTLDGLLALPGVGPYTARAVMAFAYEADVAVVDTNTARLLARWHNQQLDRKSVQRLADEAVPAGTGWAWNQAMLDLGATVCTLRNPRCAECPVKNMCAYQVMRGEVLDPAIGTAGVSVPQPKFAGSDRQVRGQILKIVAMQPVPSNEVGAAIRLEHDPERVIKLVQSLLHDGLLEENHGLLRLPG